MTTPRNRCATHTFTSMYVHVHLYICRCAEQMKALRTWCAHACLFVYLHACACAFWTPCHSHDSKKRAAGILTYILTYLHTYLHTCINVHTALRFPAPSGPCVSNSSDTCSGHHGQLGLDLVHRLLAPVQREMERRKSHQNFEREVCIFVHV